MENESLTLTAFRCTFKGSASAFERNSDPDTLGELCSQGLYKGIRRFQDDLAKYDLRLSQFLGASGDARLLQELVHRSKNHDYAVRLRLAAMGGETAQEIISLWCRDILTSVFGQIRHRVVPKCHPHFASFDALKLRVLKIMEPSVEFLTRKLANDPDWKPRRSQRSQRRSAGTPQSGLSLNTSLMFWGNHRA